MAKNTSVALSEQLMEFLAEQVATGRYGSASEVVRAGLRLLQDREVRLAELREELRKGEESGWIENFDMKGWIAEQRRKFEA